MHVCVCVLVPHISDSVRFFRLLCPGALTLRSLDMISGAEVLPWRLTFSYVCAERVPLAPAVGAVLPHLCLVPWRHRARCDVSVVCWLDACTAAWLEIAVYGSCSVVGL